MKLFYKKTLFASLVTSVLCLSTAHAQPQFDGDGWNNPHLLFPAEAHNLNGYRIPAITKTAQGTLIAFGDFRERPQYDIGGTPPGFTALPKLDLAYTVSADNGKTWTQIKRFDATHLDPDYKQVTDPAIVHDPVTGETFAFGYAGHKNLITVGSTKVGLIVYSSKDGGFNWDSGRDLTKEFPNIKFDKDHLATLQGPGNGMFYNGTLYLGIQSWTGKDLDYPRAGILFSTDHGKTWQASYVKLPTGAGDATPSGSESNVFHHKGAIYLAAKPDGHTPNPTSTQRYVFRTYDNGQTWERVVEHFFPSNVVACETSSYALNEDVYLAGYAIHNPGDRDPRGDIYITTNTGKRLMVAAGDSMGYTSITGDEDNIYFLFEGGERHGNLWFQRFDISSKEYANLPLQITDRVKDGLYVQDLMKKDKSYIKGTYASGDGSGGELLFVTDNFNVGLFFNETKENSKDVYRTIQYDTKDVTLGISKNNTLLDNDNVFLGLSYSQIDYENNSDANVVSLLAGYSLKHNIKDIVDYKLNLLGIYSDYDLDRNREEGIGRTASFKSYSATLENALAKDFSFDANSNITLTGGLRSTIFGHDGFTEDGGNGWNNAEVHKLSEYSHELFAKVDGSYTFNANEFMDVTLSAGVEYSRNLVDIEEYREEITVLDANFTMALPMEDRDNYIKGYAGAELVLYKDASIGVYAESDNNSKHSIKAFASYKF